MTVTGRSTIAIYMSIQFLLGDRCRCGIPLWLCFCFGAIWGKGHSQERSTSMVCSSYKYDGIKFYSSVSLTITNYFRCDDWFRLRCLSICASGSILDVRVFIIQQFQPSDLIQLRRAPPSSCLAAVFGIGGCSRTSCVHLASIHGRAQPLQEGLHETC